MAELTFVRAVVDPLLKKEAAVVLDGLGLTITDAILIMLQKVAVERKLPFEVITSDTDHQIPGDVRYVAYARRTKTSD